jgi:hypothetical protein
MQKNKTKLSVSLTGYYYNHWPCLKIYHNNFLLYDGPVESKQKLEFQLINKLDQNYLKFIHYGKQFGENNIWDSSPDASEQCYLNIDDIKFEGISIGPNLIGPLKFTTNWSESQLRHHDKEFIEKYTVVNSSNGMMNFNGEIVLNFQEPVLNWLTLSKYKVPRAEASYFSNYSLRWHYEEDIELINEIKKIMNLE